MSILIPCPTCSGTRSVTCEDRHAETRQDVCPTCAPYEDVHPGRVPAGTGETRAGSFDQASGRAFGDPAPWGASITMRMKDTDRSAFMATLRKVFGP